MAQKSHGPSIKDDATYERLREEGRSKEAAARIANAGTSGSKRGGRAPAYEEWTLEELRERARDVGLRGRSKMNKDELIGALRNN